MSRIGGFFFLAAACSTSAVSLDPGGRDGGDSAAVAGDGSGASGDAALAGDAAGGDAAVLGPGDGAAAPGDSALPLGDSAPPPGDGAPPPGDSAPPPGDSAPPPGDSAPPPGDSAPPGGDLDHPCLIDADNDGYGAGSGCLGSDCDDSNPNRSYGFPEIPGNNVDENCDFRIDCWLDYDGDGHAAASGATIESSDSDCSDVRESATPGNDCNDNLASINPGATEIVGDERDQNCDGQELCYLDFDNDGARHATDAVLSDDIDCADNQEERDTFSVDCDDRDPLRGPNRSETIDDGIDNDCNQGDLCYVDGDGDGYRPDATSTVVSADLDCDDPGEGRATDPTGDCDDGDASITTQQCGDSIRCGTEVCDSGPAGNHDNWAVAQHCNSTCTAWGPYCGDGVHQAANETCDDGALNTPASSPAYALHGRCLSTCDGYGPRCGDGTRQSVEPCEGANLNGATCAGINPDYPNGGPPTCTSSCTLDASTCTPAAGLYDWYALGGSELAPHSTRLSGSASGCGLSGLNNKAWRPSTSPSPMVDPAGAPILAWSELGPIVSGRFRYYALVVRWDGVQWQPFGPSGAAPGVGATTAQAVTVSVALYANGFPVVAWENGELRNPWEQRDIWVRSWDGAAWRPLGSENVSNTSTDSLTPRIAVDGQNRPVLVWQERNIERFSGQSPQFYQGSIWLKRWSGTAWEEVDRSAQGTGLGGNANASNPAILTDSGGAIVVAWNNTNSGEILVERLVNDVWTSIDGSGTTGVSFNWTPGGAALAPALAEDTQGRLWVAWDENAVTNGPSDILAVRHEGAAWVGVGGSATGPGGISNTPGHSKSPSITIDATGRPWVVWTEFDSATSTRAVVMAKRLDAAGTAWEELGGSASAGGLNAHFFSASSAKIYAPSGGVPVMVWAQGTNACGSGLYQRHWNDSAWAEVVAQPQTGGLLGAATEVNELRMRVDGSGRPTVLYGAGDIGSRQVRVVQYNGSGWVGLAGSDTGNGVSSGVRTMQPALTLDGAGRPTVAWFDFGPRDIFLKQWDGDSWEELGGSASGQGVSDLTTDPANPAVAVDSFGYPVLAYEVSGATPSPSIYMKRWDGAAWVAVGSSTSGTGASATATPAFGPQLAIDASNRIWLVFTTNNDVYGRLWDGDSWEELGGSATGLGISNTANPGGASSSSGRTALDGSGRPAVVWMEGAGFPNVRLCARRWTGSVWEDLGACSGGGLSGAIGDLDAPDITVGADGNPVVTWGQSYGPGTAAYARRWSGVSWNDIRGSSRNGGVSNSGAAASEVVVSRNGGRLCVAWHEDATRQPQILLRCVDD